MIAGIIQIIIGIIVLGVSTYINLKSSQLKFILFQIIGGMFLIYGVFAAVFDFITSKKDKEKKSDNVKKLSKNVDGVSNSIIACKKCSTKHYAYANYCQMCGNKLK